MTGPMTTAAAPYSVIIPTLGGSRLPRAVLSARRQTHPPAEIIVVGDGVSALAVPPELHEHITFLSVPRGGVSAARNAGVRAARSPWVAFLDDDDEWHPRKMERQLAQRSVDPWVVLLTAAVVVRRSRVLTRPRQAWCIGPGDEVLHHLYGHLSMSRARGYLPTPTIVTPTDVARAVPFDEELGVREDIWWLHRAQVAGVTIVQIPEALVTVHTSPTRSRGRESVASLREWSARLAGINPAYARNFLRGMALRESILGLDFDGAIFSLTESRRLRRRSSRA